MPCLTVGDVDKASAYYRRFFRFDEASRGAQGATLAGHGTAVRLIPGGGPDWRAWSEGRSPAPEALLLVRQPELLRRRLDDWGAHLVPPDELGSCHRACYGIRDCYGNVLAIGPAGGLSTAARWVAEPADSARRSLHRLGIAWVERRHRERFRAFYNRLADRRDVFYLHFNGGLLHWVVKTAGYVPEDVNLVLIGSDVPPAEQDWIRRHLRRPFHHVEIRLDGAGALELLFAVCREHFGWIDLGCFILERRLFTDLSVLDGRTALNCAWSWDSGLGFPIANPYVLFVNADVVQRVRAQRPAVGPGVYSYRRLNRQVEGRYCYTRPIGRALRRRLARLLPPAGDRPRIPGGLATFELTMMYQLVARLGGFGVTPVRPLTGFNHIRGSQVQDDSSDEVFYLSGLGRADVLEEFSGYFHDTEVRLRYALAEYLALAPQAARLPAAYRDRLAGVTSLLTGYGLAAEQIVDVCRDQLLRMWGMSPHAVDMLVGLAGEST